MKKNIQKNHFILNRAVRFALLLLISFLLSVSCKNIFEDEITGVPAASTEQSQTSASSATSPSNQKKYATIAGSLDLNGAYPETVKNEIEKPDQSQNQVQQSEKLSEANRNALPTLSSLYSKTFYIKAYRTLPAANGGTPQTVTIDGTVNQTSRAYSLGPLELGVSWTIEAGITGKYTEAGTEHLLMKAVKTNVELSEDTPAKSFDLILLPLETGGDGQIELQLSVPFETIKKIKAICTSDNSEEWNSKVSDITVSSDTVSINVSAIKSGSYDVTFYFMSDGTDTNLAFPLYTSTQTICVFENMKTNVWASGSSGGPISSGAFSLTSALIKQYSIEHIYVGDPGTGKAALDTNEGGPYSPIATIGRALQIIEKQNNTGNNYTIHISGSYAETGLTLNTTKASSITLAGINRGSTKSDITSTNHSAVLSISTTKPVYIKNLVLRNGYSNEGGGLCIKNGANVTLEEGTVIRGSTSSKGGGVYVSASTLTMKEGALIEANQAASSSNIAAGAGVYLDSGATFNFDGGTIQKNFYSSMATTGKGAGIFVADSATVKMKGGVIQNNPDTSIDAPASINGGAVYIQKSATFEISGNSSIPGDGTAGHNDVFLAKNGTALAKIKLTGNLSQTGTVAAITPEITALKTVILDGTSGLINSNSSKFVLTTENRGVSTAGKIRIDPVITDIYVKPAASGGSDSSGVGSSTSPFESLAGALKLITQQEEAHDYTIHINGTVSGAMEIPASSGTVDTPDYILIDSTTASSIELCGTSNTSDILQGPNPSVIGDDQTVLKVTTQIPVSIKKLKITGGYTTGQGGGIYIGSNSTVTLGEDALVNENVASYGGGVYNAGTLYMTSNAVIGNAAQDRIAHDVTNLLTAKRGNWAQYMIGYAGSGCGGGIYNTGKVYLGYTRYNSETDNIPDTTYSGGIYYNICCSATYSNDKSGYGGGIYSSGSNSLIVMNGGTVKNNNTGSAGGGIYLADSAQLIMKDGSIESNESRSIGGGLYIDASVSDGVVTGAATAKMSGGYIQNNVALNTNSGMPLNGLGVFVRGNFEISGSAYVKYENSLTDYTNYKNDIFLARDGAFIKVTGALIPPDAAKITVGENQVTNVAAVTPYQSSNTSVWSRGQDVVKADFDISAYKDYFSMSKNKTLRRETTLAYGWHLSTRAENKKLVLDAPMFVAGPIVSNLNICTAGGSSSGDGTISAPFNSIATAKSAMKEHVDYVITIDGPLGGCHTLSSFSGTPVPSKITIEGFSSSSTDKIESSDSTLALLTINVNNTDIPVEIDKLSLSGHTNTANTGGGGLTVEASSKVTLGSDVIISGNHKTSTSSLATDGGGGIWNGGILYIKGSKITGNSAKNGGGILNSESAILCVCGGYSGETYVPARIGYVSTDWNATTAAVDADIEAGNCTNAAKSGGGICNFCGKVYLGYTDENTPIDDQNKVQVYVDRNYASEKGGGIYSYTNTASIYPELYIAGRCFVQRNTADDNGGGLYLSSKTKTYIFGNSYIGSGATYANGSQDFGNKAGNNGGGVYLRYGDSRLYIGIDPYGNDKNPNTGSSYGGHIGYNKAKQGGGLYIYGESYSENAEIGGYSTFSYNLVTENGAAIYAENTSINYKYGSQLNNKLELEGGEKVSNGTYLKKSKLRWYRGGFGDGICQMSNIPIEIVDDPNYSFDGIIQPPSYSETVQLFKLASDCTAEAKLSKNCGMFKVPNDEEGNVWSVSATGYLSEGLAVTTANIRDILRNNNIEGVKVVVYGDIDSWSSLTSGINSSNKNVILDLSKTTVNSIPDSAFWSCSKLKGVIIPDTVTTIGERAFRYCSNMTSVTIGSGVTSIKNNAFKDTNLSSATFKVKTGWTREETAITEAQLNNTSTAASLLKDNGDWGYEWTRTP